ncbi:MAG: hypothetical protein NTV80_12865 [Verrucomicrobia bacterium]|nr:hypothetical protein [Verrucomicrobiota bacterium]
MKTLPSHICTLLLLLLPTATLMHGQGTIPGAVPNSTLPSEVQRQVIEMNETISKNEAAANQLKEESAALKKKRDALVARATGVPVPDEKPEDATSEAETPEDMGTKAYDFLTEDWNLKIRRTLRDVKENSLPALFEYTMPNGAADTWSSDIGASVGGKVLNTPLEWGVIGEYHYNEAAGALVDSLNAGAELSGLIVDMWTSGAAWKLNTAYRKDNLVGGEGVFGQIMFYPAFPALGFGGFFLGNPKGLITARIEPFLGAEVETGNGASAAFAAGERFSLRAGASIYGHLLPLYFRDRIQYTISGGYWSNVHTSGFYQGYNDHQMHMIASLTYWFNTLNKEDESGSLKKHFGLTAKYSNGDNPIEGAFDQNVWTLGFAVQF